MFALFGRMLCPEGAKNLPVASSSLCHMDLFAGQIDINLMDN